MNLYSQLQSEQEDLLDAKVTGPFCGTQQDNLPKMVVSTNHILVIWFHSNDDKTNKGFNGTWEFISAGNAQLVLTDIWLGRYQTGLLDERKGLGQERRVDKHTDRGIDSEMEWLTDRCTTAKKRL